MRVRALAGGFVLWASFCLLCAGQDGGGFAGSRYYPTPTQVRTLSGTVVNSITGEPIPGALVRILGPTQGAVMTGPDGRFELAKVPANEAFSIGAEKPGYGMTNNGMRFQPVTPGENNITIKLTPQGAIQGRIVDDQGQPLEDIQVQALAEQIVAGRKRQQMVATTSTDATGAYELGGLEPGNYLVKTRMRRLYWTAAPLAAAQQAYPGEYYPASPDRGGAQPLQVMPGQTAEADFSLAPVRTYRISGDVEGALPQMSSLMLVRSDGDALSISRRIDRETGRFMLLGVPAGSYKLRFRTYPRDGSDPVYAERQLNVDADISGLQIVPQPLANVLVNVVRPPAPQAASGLPAGPRTNVQVQLIPPGESNQRYSTMARRNSTPDTLKVRGIPPGTYRVDVQTFGSECLDTVTSGSADLESQNLIVSAGAAPQPVTVTLRNDCATLAGTIRSSVPAALMQVLLIPESGAGEPKAIGVGSAGQFRAIGITPGGYRVYAFSTLAGLEYTNPDALRDFNAQEITLGAGETANVTLNLIVRDGQ